MWFHLVFTNSYPAWQLSLGRCKPSPAGPCPASSLPAGSSSRVRDRVSRPLGDSLTQNWGLAQGGGLCGPTPALWAPFWFDFTAKPRGSGLPADTPPALRTRRRKGVSSPKGQLGRRAGGFQDNRATPPPLPHRRFPSSLRPQCLSAPPRPGARTLSSSDSQMEVAPVPSHL